MSANHWTINITCPRCQFKGDVEESFPCGGEHLAASTIEAVREALLAALDIAKGWDGPHPLIILDRIEAALVLLPTGTPERADK